MQAIGILHPLAPHRDPGRPSDSDFGRAALAAAAHGIDVVLGASARDGLLTGVVARPDRWVPATDVAIGAALHRFPDGDRPQAWQALSSSLADVPLINPDALVRTCRDKQATHDQLAAAGVAVPDQVSTDLDAALDAWGLAFLKPRFGAFGRDVRRIQAGEALPTGGDWVLQRAVLPPQGWAGVSVRVLVQRGPDGCWVACPPAARVSTTDPVVNHARGARVHPLQDLFPASEAAVRQAALEAAAALSQGPGGDDVGELGVDVVLDPHGAAWVIEVNGKPRGRLAALAGQWPDRFAPARQEALLRPVLFAASRAALHPGVSPRPPR